MGRFKNVVSLLYKIVGSAAIFICIFLAVVHGYGQFKLDSKYSVQRPLQWNDEYYVKGAQYDKLSQALVKVVTKDRRGSGVIIGKTDKDILVLTNYHVVSKALKENKLSIVLTYRDKNVLIKNAMVYAYNRLADIALVGSPHKGYPCKALTLAAVPPIKNDRVYNLSHPVGFEKVYTEGRVLEVTDTSMVVSTTVMPGSSGSPIVNEDGELVGLVKALATGTMTDAAGVNRHMYFPSVTICVTRDQILEILLKIKDKGAAWNEF